MVRLLLNQLEHIEYYHYKWITTSHRTHESFTQCDGYHLFESCGYILRESVTILVHNIEQVRQICQLFVYSCHHSKCLMLNVWCEESTCIMYATLYLLWSVCCVAMMFPLTVFRISVCILLVQHDVIQDRKKNMN